MVDDGEVVGLCSLKSPAEADGFIEIGNNGTGLLVGDRYQVQIRSTDANFTKFDREDWLKKFDLANLAQTAPLIDLFQGSQDRLYSRLFQS